MANKKYTLNFTSGEIARVSVYKSKDGYNYASVGVKKGKDHYMGINYEWSDDVTPDFVMDIMAYFGDNQETASLEEGSEDFNAFLERLKMNTETI